VRVIIEKFQSHAGSIEAREAASARVPLLPFQSHAGSIEAHRIRVATEEEVEQVSIPRWFD